MLIACYVIVGFMQGYQPAASYAFGAGDKGKFRQCVRFALKGSLLLSFLMSLCCIVCSRELIMFFNRNPVVINYGSNLLLSQMVFFMAFGLCYMMTITFQTTGASRYGLFLSVIRQGMFYLIFIQTLPKVWGIMGVYLSQPCADVLTAIACVCSMRVLKKTFSA